MKINCNRIYCLTKLILFYLRVSYNNLLQADFHDTIFSSLTQSCHLKLFVCYWPAVSLLWHLHNNRGDFRVSNAEIVNFYATKSCKVFFAKILADLFCAFWWTNIWQICSDNDYWQLLQLRKIRWQRSSK